MSWHLCYLWVSDFVLTRGSWHMLFYIRKRPQPQNVLALRDQLYFRCAVPNTQLFSPVFCRVRRRAFGSYSVTFTIVFSAESCYGVVRRSVMEGKHMHAHGFWKPPLNLVLATRSVVAFCSTPYTLYNIDTHANAHGSSLLFSSFVSENIKIKICRAAVCLYMCENLVCHIEAVT